MVKYLRAVKTFNTTNGAFKSQTFLGELLNQNGIGTIVAEITPWRQWLLKALHLRLWSKDHISLVAVDLDNKLTNRFVLKINSLLLNRWVEKYINAKCLILEGLFPVNSKFFNIKCISIIRSSPQCLVFSKMDQRRDHLLNNQLTNSDAIVCASPDAFDSWKAFGNLSNKKYIYLPVPLRELFVKEKTGHEITVDNFIDFDDDLLNILVFAGNIGPRKGLIPLLDSISCLNKEKFRVIVFGAVDSKSIEYYSRYNIEIIFRGFVSADFTQRSKHNVLRIYPALSECMSGVQLQGIFSGDMSLIYRRAIEPCMLPWLGQCKIFESFSDISQIIIKEDYFFYKVEVSEEHVNEYKNNFYNGVSELVDYAKNL